MPLSLAMHLFKSTEADILFPGCIDANYGPDGARERIVAT
jgi:hypothetical protein